MKIANVALYDSDRQFVDHLADRLSGLGIACAVCRTTDEIETLLCTGGIDVLVFGSQEVSSAVMRFLARMSRCDDTVQVILMVRKDQVRLSIEGMKNGAFDDIYIPFALDALLGKLSLAVQQRRLLQRRQQSAEQPAKGLSVFGRVPDEE
ncbi:histidine kinase [Oleidesulfovibrio sp.]|uniref:histidine kinase n=1 Tax=Oleidesulfovibrio sp. TaxID=2909707 RepID=UPI003A8A0E12